MVGGIPAEIVMAGLGAVLALASIIVLCILLLRAQRQYGHQVQALQALLKAKTLTEYAAARERLETSPKDRQKELKLENDLAKEAERLTGTNNAWVNPQ